MDVRATHRRSTSLPSFRRNGTIDEALSLGLSKFQYSRDCLQGIPPLLSNDEVRSLKRKLEDLQKKYDTSCIMLESVKRELETLRDGAELRQILSNFLKSNHVNTLLMNKAHVKYPKEFSRETDFLTFMATIRKLMEGDEKMEPKFNCLLEVAKSFRLSSLRWWDEEKGVQFYTLCYNVALLNEFDFHPKIEGETERSCRKKACEGVYKFDGVDVGPLVTKLLPASFTPL